MNKKLRLHAHMAGQSSGNPIEAKVVCAELDCLLCRPALYHAPFRSVSISNILPQDTH